MYFGCSKEPSHRGGSFEYQHHIIRSRNKIFYSVTHSYLGGLATHVETIVAFRRIDQTTSNLECNTAIYTTLTNKKYLTMCKVYTGVGGIKS